MQVSLVAAFIPVVNILWCGASAHDCNYTGSLLNLGYSKECIDSSQNSLISCSNGEAPPYKECCLAQENITNTLTEVNNLLQGMKSAEENSSSVVNSLFQEIKSEGENASSAMKSLLQEIKSEEVNSSSVVKSLLQEMKTVEENTSSVVKSLLQEIKSEGENTSSVVKSLLQEIKSEGENTSSVVKSLLQEIKSEGENTSSVVKSLLQEMKPERKNEKKSFEILLVNIENITHRISSLEISHQSDRENISKSLAAIMVSLQIINPRKNCADLRVLGKEFSGGVQTLYPYLSNPKPVVVFCDQVTDGGGWTVIQSRSPLPIRENFQRNWDDYVEGFGDLKGEFWLGLDNIHALTNSAQMEIRIDLEDAEGKKAWALYSTFHVGHAASEYILSIANYSGDAGDGMTDPSNKDFNFNGMKFSTQDNDNDPWERNCAERFKGGWWFNKCYGAHLNGRPIVGNTSNDDGIIWSPFRGWDYSMKKASMRIRPVSLGF